MRALHLIVKAVATVSAILILAAPASAQAARATGSVRDVNGKPIMGAIVRALNPEASPGEFTSATDDKGRWAMIGLRGGTWKFVAEAPGYVKVEASALVRVASTPPLAFTLARDLGPIPNALDGNIQQLLVDAAALRDQGRLDQALQAYQGIRARNPKLSSVNLVMAGVYRQKAALESDPAARRSLLVLALDAYAGVLERDATNQRALTEIESLRAAGIIRN
jgi:hypothetical protein